ncbi:MAG: hypothetical protein HY308_12035 [Gammaproteobacteria bacterium]|nr:hypothetical protein [Gammaproteobacteria bacterium]
MALSGQTVAIINRLAYPIIFEKNPLNAVDWVIETSVDSISTSASKTKIVPALQEALKNSGWIEQIAVRGNHTEETMKQFLQAILSKLM